MPDCKEERMVWIDMEMSGLNPKENVILEIAALVTDASLNLVSEGPELILSQNESLFDKMDQWNRTHHSNSGLWSSVLKSTVTLKEAEDQILEFLEKNLMRSKAPLCGNSIAQDRNFLIEYMPRVNDFLHYRMIDVSTIKELVKRWYPKGPFAPPKQNKHRALEDIKESIAELRFYRDSFFIKL